MDFNKIKFDCRFFKGDIPCSPHKKYYVHCTEADGSDCKYYNSFKEKILIIKLGAIGDVIRTTPILYPLQKDFPQAKIFWLTESPLILPNEVDVKLKYDFKSVNFLLSSEFDLVINLDKDKDACALLNKINAKNKKGFELKNEIPFPVNKKSQHKYLTGIFDDLNKANSKNYLEEIFEICDYSFSGEKYILSSFDEYKNDWKLDSSKKIVGLNTGCGGRWSSRLWSENNWIELSKKLIKNNYEVLLLGGEQENQKNQNIAQLSGAKYFGYFHLEKFINLVNQCDIVVTSVTMAMHIAIGLQKKVVLFNNIFNKNEFELYGLGEIVQPEKECKCFFSASCSNTDYQCMDYIYPKKVFDIVFDLLLK